MDINGVREAIYELASYYFKGATVVIGRQSRAAKQGVPLVIIQTGAVSRPINPPIKVIDGRPVSFYPSTVSVQLDLFTMGKKVRLSYGFTDAAINTAKEDLLGFMSFLNSDITTQYCNRKDIAIIVPNTVQDLTGIINETNYEYRAMAEVEVRFTSVAIGYSGVLSVESIKHAGVDGNGRPIFGTDADGNPILGTDIQDEDVSNLVPEIESTPSGGGNPDVLESEDGYFINVEINNKLMKEEN